MPTYEYQCKKCGHTFEKFQSMQDKPIKRCPDCRSVVKRLIGAGAGIIFKGSGFYETDYRRAKSKESSGKEDGSLVEGKDRTEKPSLNKEAEK